MLSSSGCKSSQYLVIRAFVMSVSLLGRDERGLRICVNDLEETLLAALFAPMYSLDSLDSWR